MTPPSSANCALTGARLDLATQDSVKVICELHGEQFFLFVDMDAFFSMFATHELAPHPLPGLRLLPRDRQFNIRFEFDQEKFIEAYFANSRNRIRGGAFELWRNLLKQDGSANTPRPENGPMPNSQRSEHESNPPPSDKSSGCTVYDLCAYRSADRTTRHDRPDVRAGFRGHGTGRPVLRAVRQPVYPLTEHARPHDDDA